MEPICATFLNPIFLIFVRVRFQLEFGLYLSTVNCDIFGFCLAPLQLNHSTSASFEFPMISIKNFFAVDIKNYITSHFKKISLKHLIKQKVYLAVEKYFGFLNTPAAFLSLTHHSPETQKTLSLEGQEDSTQIYLYLNGTEIKNQQHFKQGDSARPLFCLFTQCQCQCQPQCPTQPHLPQSSTIASPAKEKQDFETENEKNLRPIDQH